MRTKKQIEVQGIQITLTSQGEQDYICLTDMTKSFEGGSSLIENWLRNKNTVEFLGVWERLNNPNFNSVEFDGIYSETGSNKFYISISKFIKQTNAIGLVAKRQLESLKNSKTINNAKNIELGVKSNKIEL